jgi:hypothetical protein
MRYFYYDEATSAVTVLPEEAPGFGIQIGRLQGLHGLKIQLLVHSMLSKRGISAVGLSITEHDTVPDLDVTPPAA